MRNPAKKSPPSERLKLHDPDAPSSEQDASGSGVDKLRLRDELLRMILKNEAERRGQHREAPPR